MIRILLESLIRFWKCGNYLTTTPGHLHIGNKDHLVILYCFDSFFVCKKTRFVDMFVMLFLINSIVKNGIESHKCDFVVI